MNYRSLFSIATVLASVLFFTIYFRKGKSEVKLGKTVSLQTSMREMSHEMQLSMQGIEDSILHDYNFALAHQKPDCLLECIYDLKRKDSITNNAFIRYWEAFALYKLSFYYNEDSCEISADTSIKAAIALLNKNNFRSSEEWALLSMLKSAYRRYAPVTAIHSLSKESIEAATMALQIDSQNLRAYLALGLNDFFTPRMFGGGTKAKAYFREAIGIQPNETSNGLLPGWGRDRAFFYLIKSYVNDGDTSAAQQYYRLSIPAFPDDTSIKNALNY